MSASASGMRGGTPSTTTPIAGPWLSTQVVNRKSVPKLLPAKLASLDDGDVACVQRLHADHVVTAIDVVHLAPAARRKLAQEVERGIADLLERDAALQAE